MTKISKTALIFIIALPLVVQCQQTIIEPSTGKSFPAEVQFQSGGKAYTLSATGLTVRKKLFFKVYGMAHYLQDAEKVSSDEEAFKHILTDGKAKQITMDFARDVDVQKIKDAYSDGFKQYTTSSEMQKIKPLVDQFIGYFKSDMKENEQFILRWLPGGSIVTIIKGEEKPVLTHVIFARALWTIWFGEDSIVDRDDLVEKMIK